VTLRRVQLLAMSYLLVVALVAFGVPLALSLRQRVDSEVRSQARSSADVLAISAAALIADRDTPELADLALRSAASLRARTVIVDATGRVVADSAGNQTRNADYSTRPEFAQALRGRRFQTERRSATLGQEILVTSTPVVADGRREGAVRITQQVGAIERAVGRNVAGLALVGAVVLLVGLGVALTLARLLTRPLLELRTAAERVAAGDLSGRLTESGPVEQRSLARAFNAMTDRVARALDAQQAFVADASHQLRTPLTGLRLRLETLRAGTREPGALDQIDAATEEVDRLSRTVDELLVLSAGRERDVHREALDLSSLARRAVIRWAATAADRDQEIVLEQHAPGREVHASPADLDRVLDALIENSLRYSPPSSTVTVRIDGDAIAVQDEGPGFTAEDLGAVFERFRRGSAGMHVPSGTGLGLAIARELANRWGGNVELANAPDAGALVRLTIPPFDGPLPRVD
jgi:two-component system, OmpR family, sensor kinase